MNNTARIGLLAGTLCLMMAPAVAAEGTATPPQGNPGDCLVTYDDPYTHICVLPNSVTNSIVDRVCRIINC
jgi:hypothetical protein